MKKMHKVLLLALVAAFAVSAAQAVTLTPGPIVGKFSDVGSFYPGGGLVPLPNPAGTFVPIAPGDELRNIFSITTIHPDVIGADPDFTTNSVTGQLSGIVAGLTPLAALAGPGPVVVELGNLGPQVVGAPGGILRVYLDEPVVSPFSAAAGPAGWVTPTTYPTVNTSGEPLWLDCVFIPFPGGAPSLTFPGLTLLRETVNIGGSETGEGFAYLMVVGGSFAPQVVPGGQNAAYLADGGYLGGGTLPPGLTADVKIHFELQPDEGGAPPWGTSSEDPFRLSVVVPEPMTMIGLLLGTGGLGGYLRRRRVA